MDLGLKNKVALVTGGSRGLGRAICLGLAAEGAKVAINYRRDEQGAAALADEIRTTLKTDVRCLQGDVSRSSEVTRTFDECRAQLGEVDILVNNAGIWPTAYVHEIEEADWDETLAINLRGPFLMCREAVRRWTAGDRGGRIVNISSPAAFRGSTTGHAHYAASKAGLVSFTVSLAREVAPHGIFANAVAPGMMWTDMAREALEKNEQHYIERIPLRRIAEPGEVASFVVFLASDKASYTTGATVDVSGGMLMR
jgi:3-oxoacyl-[acyl-carrier protein] reductase